MIILNKQHFVDNISNEVELFEILMNPLTRRSPCNDCSEESDESLDSDSAIYNTSSFDPLSSESFTRGFSITQRAENFSEEQQLSEASGEDYNESLPTESLVANQTTL